MNVMRLNHPGTPMEKLSCTKLVPAVSKRSGTAAVGDHGQTVH